MKFSLYQYFLAFTAIVFTAGCNNDLGSPCDGNAIASWKANGLAEEARVYTQTNTDTTLYLNFAACGSTGNVVAFDNIPSPPVAGTYMLNSNIQGIYLFGVVERYETSEQSTGSLTITTVDTINKTLSGNFAFTAKQDSGSAQKQITEGIITNARYAD